MSFQLPDFQSVGVSIPNEIQTRLYGEWTGVLHDAIRGTNCVLSGGACTSNSNMTVAVAKGAANTGGSLKGWAAQNVTIGTADALNPRVDIIVVDSTGALQVRAGTAAPSPVPPVRTSNDVALQSVFVGAGVTSITAGALSPDLRQFRSGLLSIGKVASAVTHNTDNAAFDYYTLTVPDGLFATAGRRIRVVGDGDCLINSGTMTWTVEFLFGGSTLWKGTTNTLTNDANRRGWGFDVKLMATSSTSQRMNGHFFLQNPYVAVAAPTTGTYGQITNVANGANPIGGVTTVDADAANRDFVVRITMAVSNANNEIVLRQLSAVLE